MIVEVEPICDCPCENEFDDFDLEDNSSILTISTTQTPKCKDADQLCNNNGKMVCGECRCCGDLFGPNCTCTPRNGVNPKNPGIIHFYGKTISQLDESYLSWKDNNFEGSKMQYYLFQMQVVCHQDRHLPHLFVLGEENVFVVNANVFLKDKELKLLENIAKT